MPELGERGFRGAPHPLAIDDGERSARRLHAENDVLHRRQVRRQRQLLIDHRDARLPRVQRIARRVRRAAEPHHAGIGFQRTGEDCHQRALAGAVLADETAHLALAHHEVDAVERDRRGE